MKGDEPVCKPLAPSPAYGIVLIVLGVVAIAAWFFIVPLEKRRGQL